MKLSCLFLSINNTIIQINSHLIPSLTTCDCNIIRVGTASHWSQWTRISTTITFVKGSTKHVYTPNLLTKITRSETIQILKHLFGQQ